MVFKPSKYNAKDDNHEDFDAQGPFLESVSFRIPEAEHLEESIEAFEHTQRKALSDDYYGTVPVDAGFPLGMHAVEVLAYPSPGDDRFDLIVDSTPVKLFKQDGRWVLKISLGDLLASNEKGKLVRAENFVSFVLWLLLGEEYEAELEEIDISFGFRSSQLRLVDRLEDVETTAARCTLVHDDDSGVLVGCVYEDKALGLRVRLKWANEIRGKGSAWQHMELVFERQLIRKIDLEAPGPMKGVAAFSDLNFLRELVGVVLGDDSRRPFLRLTSGEAGGSEVSLRPNCPYWDRLRAVIFEGMQWGS